MRRLAEFGFIGGMAWEQVALLRVRIPIIDRTLPTITSLVRATRTWPLPAFLAAVVTVAGGLIYAGFHLLVDGWPE